ncbi:MAG: hypothetical protein J6J35_05140 [Alphaproteobacteria bacterium]|nr:hypothetical protein [Alphaproteobacteria bacterium]
MSDILMIGIGAMLICFTVATFFLSRLQTDVFPEEYEFALDPFWYVIGIMFVGGLGAYFLCPTFSDMIKTYSWVDFALPFIFAFIIYGAYLLDVEWVTSLVTFAAALAISFMQPDEFSLFAPHLTPLEDKFAVALIIFVISKGLGLLNGLGGIASMQFLTVMAVVIALVYFNALPNLLGVIAAAYFGTMLAFAFFSFPPEKIVMSDGAFSSLGFVMGCFMLNGANEYAESSMFIAVAFLMVETGRAFYERFILRRNIDMAFMNTAYYKISNNGAYEKGVVYGVFKILFINLVLAVMQIAASERFAVPFFAAALDVWFLSILSGDTKPQEFLSLIKTVARFLFKKKNKTDKK